MERAPGGAHHRTAGRTLAACAAAGFALVLAVGMQAPATSDGPRWRPSRRSRTPATLNFEGGDWEITIAAQPGSDVPAWVYWILIALAAIAILRTLLRWIRHDRLRAPLSSVVRFGPDIGQASEADAKIVSSGLAAALAILESERSSTDAVVLAWQGLQDAAATAGLGRRPAETASEFTARILYRSRRSAEPIAVLLSLYHRVRFGHHAPNANEVIAARAALATLGELWQADLPGRGARRVAGL